MVPEGSLALQGSLATGIAAGTAESSHLNLKTESGQQTGNGW